MKIFKNKYGEIRSGWDMLWVSLTIIFGIQLLVSFVLLAISIVNPNISLSSPNIQMIVQIICTYLSIFFLLLIWKLYHKDVFINLGLTRKNGLSDLIYGLILGIVAIGLVYSILLIFKQLTIENIDISIIFTPKYILFIILFIGVGFWEEMLSRGYYMSILKRTRNIYAIIFIPASLFSLLHIFNPNPKPLGFLNIFMVGILFALIFYKRGSIWMAIGFHITWNFFQGNIFGLNVSGVNAYSIINNKIDGNEFLTGGAFGAEGGLITTLILILLILVFISLKKKEGIEFWSIKKF